MVGPRHAASHPSASGPSSNAAPADAPRSPPSMFAKRGRPRPWQDRPMAAPATSTRFERDGAEPHHLSRKTWTERRSSRSSQSRHDLAAYLVRPTIDCCNGVRVSPKGNMGFTRSPARTANRTIPAGRASLSHAARFRSCLPCSSGARHRRSGRRRCGCSVTGLGLVADGAAAAAGTTANAAPPTAPPTTFSTQPPVSRAGGVITRSAHVAFEGCTARHITVGVSIARDAFPIGQAVTYEVSVTNSGSTACGPAQNSVPPLRRALTIGPCGVLPGVIANATGLDVYRGREVFGCPLFSGSTSVRTPPSRPREPGWASKRSRAVPTAPSCGKRRHPVATT